MVQQEQNDDLSSSQSYGTHKSNSSDKNISQLVNQQQWREAEERLLNNEELKEIAEKASVRSPYYVSSGCGCRALESLSLGEPLQLLKRLDCLAEELASLEIGFYQTLGFDFDQAAYSFDLNNSINPEFSFNIEYVASGFFGSVYKLSAADGRTYALKAFYRRSFELEFSGPWNEAALGVYVTAQHVSNMPHLCAANPAAGWLLSEFVDADYENPTPDGPTWAELGLITLDYQKDADNLLHNRWGAEFRVDFGHLTTLSRNKPAAFKLLKQIREGQPGKFSRSQFMKIFKANQNIRGELCGKLAWVRPQERIQTLHDMFRYSESKFFPLQEYISSGVLPPEDTLSLFSLKMQSDDRNVRAQAIFDLRKLQAAEAAFLKQEWLQRGEFEAFRRYFSL